MIKKHFYYMKKCVIIMRAKVNKGGVEMKHIKTLTNKTLKNTMKNGGVENVKHLANLHVRHLVQ